MSSKVEVYASEVEKETSSWGLWGRQIWAIFRSELKKNIFNRRAIFFYILALFPALLFSTFLFVPFNKKNMGNQAFFNQIFAQVFEALSLRVVLFFGCSWLFINLFRAEVMDKSLHYYFLTPVRRELLVVAKYFSAVVISSTLFSIVTAISLFFAYTPRGYEAGMQYFFEGPGLSHALAYLGITVLGCIGYGSIFLLFGLFFRNPIIPAVFLYGWEMINFLLPPILKKLSIIFYLQSLTPIKLSVGPYAIVAEPASPWIAIPSMLLLTTFVLIVACLKVRKMEISYGNE